MQEPAQEFDLIPLREACKMIPSHQPGKCLSIATMWRWVLKGRIPAVRRGHYYFVRRADVLKLAAGEPVTERIHKPESSRKNGQPKTSEWAEKVLRQHGIM